MRALQPPTVPGRPFMGSLREFRTGAFDFLLHTAQQHGDVVRFFLGLRPVYLISRPDLIHDVLITHSRNFRKGPGQRMMRSFLGEGLLTSEGEWHLRQRRLTQPAFHRHRLTEYGRGMVSLAVRAREAWQEAAALDVTAEMTQLSLAVLAHSLFGDEVDNGVVAATDALLLDYFHRITRPMPRALSYLPIPSTFRTRRAARRLDDIVLRLIDARRRLGEDRGDLLSMLIAASDRAGDGTGMTDRQVRDELVTIVMAGHATIASALGWTWYVMAQHPEVEARLHAELDEVLGNRPPTADDCARLPYLRMVFAEVLRLYPPTWAIARQAIEAYRLDAFTVPAGALIMISPYVMHYDSRFYPDPFMFDPERWTREAAASRPRFAFLGFGGGQRQCIGEAFAWMEAVLLVATIAQTWRLRLVPGQTVVRRPSPSLRAEALVMTAHRRPTPLSGPARQSPPESGLTNASCGRAPGTGRSTVVVGTPPDRPAHTESLAGECPCRVSTKV